ncbi:YceI family protein [Hymenobacter sp. BT507]|uniref:YceI family protein n=1 Tax=Hymenobacter citatus TaxID=2763506 RepID=A0ABR7MH03_9BACT|nr:YceI family protein [Hymenobacter citatus]MBC6610328.1 YceI family protein [Hymenobacter citatus]
MNVLLMLLVVLPAWLAVPLKYTTRTASISFFSSTPLEDIDAHNRQVGAAFDAATGQVAFTAAMRDFQFKRSLMQEHFNENYMESERYPKATFAGRVLSYTPELLQQAGPQTVQVEGDLTLHGVTRRVRVPGTLELRGTQLLMQSKFTVAPADFKIEIPALVRAHLAKTMEVTVEAACGPAT